MSILSVASRTPLEAEREENDKKKAPFLPQIWYLERTLPQNTPQLGSLCYTLKGSVREGISPIEELERWIHLSRRCFSSFVREGISPIEELERVIWRWMDASNY